MKKWLGQIVLMIIVAAVTSLLVVRFLGMPQKQESTKSETAYQRVINTGILRCGYAISPPVLIKDPNTGKVSGLSYDIWENIGMLLGLKIEWTEEAGWGNFIEGLNTERYDAFCAGMWPDEARSKYLTLTSPSVYSLVQAYVRVDDHRFDGDLEKVNDPAIISPAIDGDISAMAIRMRFPKAQLLSLPQISTLSDMIMSVTTNKADVVFLDQAMFDSYDKNNPDKLRKLENVPSAFSFGVRYGFKSGEIQLRDMVNIALQAMIDNGSLEKLAKSYSADYMTPHKNYDTR